MIQRPPADTDAADRLEAIDILRGVALFGVLLVNLIGEFRVSLFQQFLPRQLAAWLPDRMVEVAVTLALEMKAFAVFSFLFGLGLAIQFDRLRRRGNVGYWLSRRLLVLLAFGLAHLLLLWNGDILTEYALLGLLVLPFLWAPTWVIAVGSGLSLAFFVAMPMLSLPLSWPDAQTLERHVSAANVVYATGTASAIRHFAQNELGLLLPLHLAIIPRTAALFLLGMLLWRAGLMQRLRAQRTRLGMVGVAGIALGGGLTAATAFGGLAQWGVAAAAAANLAALILAGGYAALILALTQYPCAQPALSLFAPVGRMAFSNYIAQSVVFGYIYFGYGLGYFGRMGAVQALTIGVVVYLAQTFGSRGWLARFRYGPLEWLWRSLMYGALQPMRRQAAAVTRP